MKLSKWFTRQPRHWILVEMLVITALIGWLDRQLPYAWTMFVFYLWPVLLVGLYCSWSYAIFTSLFSVGIWFLSNIDNQPYNTSTFLWIGLNRLAGYLMVGLAGSAMRSHREAVVARLRDLERTRELEEALVQVSEREQMRIGQDLHDGLCQQLAALDCAVACLRQDLDDQQLASEADTASFIQKQLRSALLETRNLARGVFPVQINEEGFLAALQELVATINRLRQFAVTLEVGGEIKIPDPQVGMHLYRIAQEALNNVGRHAQATEVTISISRQNGHLIMVLADNGRGLPESAQFKPGLGLQTMKYRATSLGGTFTAHNVPGGGAKLVCKVPLATASAPLDNKTYERDLVLRQN